LLLFEGGGVNRLLLISLVFVWTDFPFFSFSFGEKGASVWFGFGFWFFFDILDLLLSLLLGNLGYGLDWVYWCFFRAFWF